MREELIYEVDRVFHPYARNIKQIKYVVNANGCWECTSHAKSHGYVYLQHEGRTWGLHRLSYEIENGPIPPGMCILHSCDNPTCFNPEHLSVGTQADNINDKLKKGRGAKGSSQGHAKLTEDDVRKIRNDDRVQHVIAKCYGVSQTIISDVKNRKSWKHVE